MTERPDETSARITARIQGSRVEITNDRTENTTTWANPDGTLTTDSSITPVRAPGADGSWKPVDYDLVATDGGFAPKASTADVWFSGGGSGPAAVTKKGDRELTLSLDKSTDATAVGTWAAKLPAPAIKDNTATYQLNDAVSLVLTATGTGMEESVVLASQPSTTDLDGVLDQFHLRAGMKGLAAHDTGDGVAFTKPTASAASGPVITAGATTVFDAQTDADGDPSNTLTVPTTLTPDPVADSSQAIGVTDAAGTAPDELTTYLSDPSTVYPVTIDPSVNLVESRDTWIEGADTSSHGGDANMKIGYDSGSAHQRRALLHFTMNSAITGNHVTAATLQLFQSGGSTCTAEPINVYPITSAWDNKATWANQPSVSSTNMASASFSHGYSSSCPNAYGSVTVTGMVNAWANGTANNGMEVRAGNETAAAQDKTLCAMDWDKSSPACYTPSHMPVLSVTYDRPPATPAAPAITTTPASSAGYSIKTTPTLSGTISDPDANAHAVFTVKNSAGAVVWTGTTGTGNGTYKPTVPAGKLSNAWTYTATVAAVDGSYTKTSAATTFTVDTTPPTVALTATHYTSGQWNTADPTSDTFTLKGSADTKSFAYSLNGGAAKTVAANSSGTAAFTWTPAKGANTITATATDKAGNTSAKNTFGIGTGPGGITHLVDHPVSTDAFPIQANGPGGATGTTARWRFSGAAAWTPIDSTTLKLASTGSTWDGKPVATTIGGGTVSASATPQLMWNATDQAYTGSDGKQVNLTAPALIDLQICFTYAGGVTQCATENGAQLVPSAFGGNFPTTDMGPAQVALTTGEMALSESDAADQSAGVGRTFSSYDPGTIATGPFGPGWSAALDSSADSEATLIDNRSQDGTFVLVTTGDASQVYTPTSNSGTFAPLGVDDQSRLQLSNDGQSVTLTHPGSEKTTWNYSADDQAWVFDDSKDLTDGTSTKVTYDQGHPAWVAETTPGDTAACTRIDQEPGCRGLLIHYTGTGTATRVASVDLVIGAAGGTGKPTPQATYTYTGTGASALLTKVCGPDPDKNDSGDGPQSPLCETYTYDTTTVAGRTLLTTLTPPGQATWTFTYDSQGRLTKVTRPQASDVDGAGSSTATWSIDYNVTPTGTGLPDLSAAAANVWGQDDVPSNGYAVFDPSYTPSGTPTADDLKHASLWYTDTEGNTTNTATWGTTTADDGTPTSQWLIDATGYDHNGNVVSTLDPAGIIAAQGTQAEAIADGADADDALAAAQHAATDRSAVTVYSADGSRVSDEYGPAHTAYLKGSDTPGTYRTHTHYVYDDQAPDQGGADKPQYDTAPDPDTGVEQTTFNLVVETDTSAADPDMNPDGSGDHDTVVTRNNYAPIVSTDENGWTLGEPTQTSVGQRHPDGSYSDFTVTSTTRYDSDGNQIESRQPGGAADGTGAGSDAHSMVTSYYSKTNADPDCEINDHPDRAGWEGLPCKTGPAAQPTDPDGSGITQHVPVTWDETYDAQLQPTVVVETSGATTRKTTTVYDGLERPTQVTVEDGHDKRVQNYGYDPTSGQQTTIDGAGSTSIVGGTITTGYDSWGRTTSYTDGTGNLTQTSYTADGQTAETTGANGTTTYQYAADGTGALNAMTSSAGSGTTTFTMGYDADGDPLRVGYGNAITATYGYDEAGNTTSLDYQNSNGDDLAGFTNILDVNGNVQEADSTATGATQDYTYDVQGRLTHVQDTQDDGCTTRAYGFDATSDRTSLDTYGPADDGSCQNTSTTSSRTWSYDDGNRITNTGYSYDDLGRTLTVPAADTNAAADSGASALKIGYYANDMAASLTQTITGADGGAETDQNAFALDSSGRIDQIVTTARGTEQTKETYEFGNDSDSPTAISTYVDATADVPAATILTRYLTFGELGMVASTNESGTVYQLTDLHGDVVANADNSSGIGAYDETDEYGNPSPSSKEPSASTERYGYLGAGQRTDDAVGGVILMGARLFDTSNGQFLSEDPVRGGNATAYDYPADPVNQSDVTGMWCIGGKIGTTCPPPSAKRPNGTVVRLRSKVVAKVWNKHGVTLATLKWAIGHSKFYAQESSTVYEYRVTIRGAECNYFGRNCVPNPEQLVVFRMVVDYRKLSDGYSYGLVTAYCMGMVKCPSWVNSSKLN